MRIGASFQEREGSYLFLKEFKGMGTKIQSKTYFPGSVRDLNNGLCNGMWDARTSGSGNSRFYDSFLVSQPAGGYTGYAKEHIRQTILKQESIFRNQLQELHRLYKRQRDLMNEVTRREKQVENAQNSSIKQAGFLADLNEPIQVDETSFSASVSNKYGNGYPAEELQRRDLPANKKSEFCLLSKFSQQNYKEQLSCNFLDGRINQWFQPEPRKAIEHLSFPKFNQNKPEPQMKKTIFGFKIPDSSRQIPEFLAGNKCVNTRYVDSSVVNLEGLGPVGNKQVSNDHKTPDKKLPPWLISKPTPCNEQIKSKETVLYQMNLDSLQNHSQQFFKKPETAQDGEMRELKKVKTGDLHKTMKILGVPIVDVPNNSKNTVTASDPIVENHGEVPNLAEESCKKSNSRQNIDLNLALIEEEAPQSTETAVGSETKSADMKLKGPDLTSEVDSKDTQSDLFTVAAEAIVSISSSKLLTVDETPEKDSDDTLLLWLADVISSQGEVKKDFINVDKDSIPEGMDQFEYLTLKLEDAKDECYYYKPMVLETENEKETGVQPKRTARKGRGRQRKDFQRDILPSIVSLSRREVSEDLLTFEEALNATGVCWQSSLSRRKAAAKNSRSRRQSVVSDHSSQTPPPAPAPPSVEHNICCLGGWGKRTRRLPRHRCPNGGNRHSLALKC